MLHFSGYCSLRRIMLSHTMFTSSDEAGPCTSLVIFLMGPLLFCCLSTCMALWLKLLLAFPEPQRTWPGMVLPSTFPLMKCIFYRSAWPGPTPWPSLNGNFPFSHASLPASLCLCHSGVSDSCPEQPAFSQGLFDS